MEGGGVRAPLACGLVVAFSGVPGGTWLGVRNGALVQGMLATPRLSWVLFNLVQ